MADDKNLMQEIDKIAYGVCGVLALAVLGLAFLSDGGIAEEHGTARTKLARVEELHEAGDSRGPIAVPELAPVLEEQWKLPSVAAKTSWLTERNPILVRKSKKIERAPAVHVPGYIAEIALLRDAEKQRPYLRIRGAMSDQNDGVRIETVTLYRRVDDGQPSAVPEFSATGDFEYADSEVKPGSRYSYHFTTRAVAVGGRPLAKPDQTSAELGPTQPVPYDFTLSIVTMLVDANNQPTVRARSEYWDYAAGSMVEGKTESYAEGAYIDSEKRYQLRSIDGAGRTRVLIRDHVLRKNISVESADKRTVATWAPLTGEPASVEPEPAAEAGADPAAATADGAVSDDAAAGDARPEPEMTETTETSDETGSGDAGTDGGEDAPPPARRPGRGFK